MDSDKGGHLLYELSTKEVCQLQTVNLISIKDLVIQKVNKLAIEDGLSAKQDSLCMTLLQEWIPKKS
ncbi:hypothetical protein TI04_13755 [Achromatium sp. WMS2]|nr:hypothetical protein TI04_13755 [Achromatium sp. WMS2]